jgi:hypothetical protein
LTLDHSPRQTEAHGALLVAEAGCVQQQHRSLLHRQGPQQLELRALLGDLGKSMTPPGEACLATFFKPRVERYVALVAVDQLEGLVHRRLHEPGQRRLHSTRCA